MAENENNNLQVPEEPEFIKEIPGIDPEDPVHFAQMNGILEKLLGNDVFLEKLANKMIEKNLIAHVLDCENAQMVLGADQAPVITGLIDGVKEDVTQLYSEIGDVTLKTKNLFVPLDDLNDAYHTGIYLYIGLTANRPGTTGGLVIMISSGAYATMLAIETGTGKMYIRTKTQDKWNDWSVSNGSL